MDAELDERIKKVADWCLSNGISVIPIDRESKSPKIKWGEFIGNPMPSWNFENANIAILTGEENGIVVVDCDTAESSSWWWRNRPRTGMMVRTARGIHFYYRWPAASSYIKSDAGVVAEGDITYDVKASRSYTLFSPSISKSSGHQYQIIVNDDNLRGAWVDPAKLPEFDPAWRPERVVKDWSEGSKIKDIRAYMAKVFAREGNFGDRDTYRLVCILHDNEVPEADAMALMCEWNQTNAVPPWGIDQLRKKISAVYN